MLKFWVPTPPRFLAFTFIILFFVLLRLVIFLSCRNRLVRFVQHIGVRISNHEQPKWKTTLFTNYDRNFIRLSSFFCFYFPLMHDSKESTSTTTKKLIIDKSGVRTYDFKPSITLQHSGLLSNHCPKRTTTN